MSGQEVPVRDVDPDEAMRMMADGALLLDVREPAEWDAGHIIGAVHRPLGDLDIEAVPGDVPVVALCRSGNRSSKAAAALASSGHDVVNLAGGMKAWHERGLPVLTDDGSAGTVS